MPEYLSPGVYIQEVNSGARPIEGVGAAMAAFVGFAPAGPANKRTLITNWSQYVETFGAVEDGGRRNPRLADAYLSHAVYGYFLNGGGRCYVDRVVTTNGKADGHAADGKKRAPLQLPGRAAKQLSGLGVTPKGTAAADIQVEIAPPTGDDQPEGTFTLKVRSEDRQETYDNVTLSKKGGRNVVETVNKTSTLIQLAELAGVGSLIERTPGYGSVTLKASEPTTAVVVHAESKDFVGDVVDRSGIEGLEVADDVTMVCCPDLYSAFRSEDGEASRKESLDKVKAVQSAMIAHAERLGNRMAILDGPPEMTAQEIKKWRERESNYDSKYAALYYPWITVDGPDGK